MAGVQVPFTKLAEIALSAMTQAKIQADDETIEMVRATRGFLRAIAQGQLVVSSPAAEAPPIAGSEGIVPAPAQHRAKRR